VKRFLLLGAAAVTMLAVLGNSAAADEGWSITSFDADYTVNTDGSLAVIEDIQVDFGTLDKHGIYRDFFDRIVCTAPPRDSEPRLSPCAAGSFRSYAMAVSNVAKPDGTPWESLISDTGNAQRIRIGDPSSTISGKQTYHIAYTVHGALDAYASADELYWNVTGNAWPVHSFDKFRLTLHLPEGANLTLKCFQGGNRSTEACAATATGNTAVFESTRVLRENEGVTIAARWQKGLVTIEPPYINVRPGMTSDAPQPAYTTIGDFFTLDVIELGGFALVSVVVVALLWRAWWRNGRDRRYKTLFYLTNDPGEQSRPLFAHTDVVVEYLPPDDLRPAQMGVILDERADTLDVTATIVDLAVRGYLHITEIPKEGFLGHADWKLEKLDRESDLQPYETELLGGLFEGGTVVQMSELKNKFVTRLQSVKTLLYADAMQRKWFAAKPETARGMWVGVAGGVTLLGAAAAFFSGYFLGRALLGVPIIAGGLALLFLSRSMARRTATGSEALRRVLGFRLYIATAETRRQEFNEQQNIFARYLPFAIVFGCVGKWAKAFEGLDDAAQQSTQGWYTSTVPFQIAAFSAGLQSFSSSVSSSIASSPSSSGGSGFSSGGSSGGGGGGGGGGSW